MATGSKKVHFAHHTTAESRNTTFQDLSIPERKDFVTTKHAVSVGPQQAGESHIKQKEVLTGNFEKYP